MQIQGRKVEWHPKTIKGISQIPKDGMEFAYVSEDYKQVHQLVWCKDFMQDLVFGCVNQTSFEVYNFKYDPATEPQICLDKTRFMICNWRDESFEQKLLNNCKEFLHELETQMKMKKTIFEKCTNPPPIYRRAGVFIVEGSKRWMIAPPMISLYTLLIRIGMVHPLGQSAKDTLDQIESGDLRAYNWKPAYKTSYGTNRDDNDSDHLSSARIGLERILKYGDRKLFHKDMKDNYLEELGIDAIHDDCGLCGFSNDYTNYHFPHWHRLEDE